MHKKACLHNHTKNPHAIAPVQASLLLATCAVRQRSVGREGPSRTIVQAQEGTKTTSRQVRSCTPRRLGLNPPYADGMRIRIPYLLLSRPLKHVSFTSGAASLRGVREKLDFALHWAQRAGLGRIRLLASRHDRRRFVAFLSGSVVLPSVKTRLGPMLMRWRPSEQEGRVELGSNETETSAAVGPPMASACQIGSALVVLLAKDNLTRCCVRCRRGCAESRWPDSSTCRWNCGGHHPTETNATPSCSRSRNSTPAYRR